MSRTSSPLRPDARVSRGDDGAPSEVVLHLLAGFGVDVDGEEVPLPGSAQRLVAFVALHERPVLRPYAAGTLWLDWPEARAAGNLRSALWRIQRNTPELVSADAHMLRLAAVRAGRSARGGDARTRRARGRARRKSSPRRSPSISCRTGTTTGSCSSASASGSCGCVRSSPAARA